MKFWLGLRQGHWGCLPRVSSPTTASVGNCIRCCQYMGSISLLFWTDAALRCITAVFVCLFCFVSFPMHYVFSFLNLWLYWLVSLCLFTGPVGFLIQTVFYFLQVQWRDFSRWELSLFFFYSSFTWCTWEAEHLITAGLGYTDTAVVQEATCSHFRGAKQTILSLLRAEASHILEASGQEFVGYFYPCYQWDRKRCTKLFSINQWQK